MNSTSLTVRSKRLGWIDWMKTFGMYFIVLGHFFSFGDKYIYVFNVPLFFFISGFLCKKETERRVFWIKIWYNLAIPLLLLSTINYTIGCLKLLADGKLEIMTFVWFVRNVLFGVNAGFGVCWFVYTLIILKILFQLCSNRNWFYLLLPIMLCLIYVYNHNDLSNLPFFLNNPSAIVNVCTAYPFFAFGVYANQYKDKLDAYNKKGVLAFTLMCSILFVYLSGMNNDYVLMYKCGYGGNMFWFLLGGIAGSYCIFALSKLICVVPKSVKIISSGTILILAFHFYLIDGIREIYKESYMDYLFAAAIIILFIPIIIIAEKHFPLIIGKYRASVKGTGS